LPVAAHEGPDDPQQCRHDQVERLLARCGLPELEPDLDRRLSVGLPQIKKNVKKKKKKNKK